MRCSHNTTFLVATLAASLWVCASPARGAATIDLRGGLGASGSANGAYFEWVDENSTGTGVIDSFLRIQANGTERGYNTDGTLEFDTKNSHTKALPLSAVPIVKKGGTSYREFLLDIGESLAGNSRFLSLDTMEIYMANSATLTGYPALGTKVFDLDVGPNGGTTVLMDASLNPGNGWGDVFAYIPSNLLTGGNYVYLYSAFGGTYASGSSPEEWAVRLSLTPVIPPIVPPPSVPVPGALVLVLAGSSIAVSLHRRRVL